MRNSVNYKPCSNFISMLYHLKDFKSFNKYLVCKNVVIFPWLLNFWYESEKKVSPTFLILVSWSWIQNRYFLRKEELFDISKIKSYATTEVPCDSLYSQTLKKSGIVQFIFTVKKKYSHNLGSLKNMFLRPSLKGFKLGQSSEYR